jgi:membrane protease YdiL (CAAX protease family)
MPSSGAKPRVWPIFVAYLAALGFKSTAGVVVLVVALVLTFRTRELSGPPDPTELEALMLGAAMEPWVVLASGAISALALSGAALVAAKLSPTGVIERLRLGRASGGNRRFAVAPLAALATLAAGSAVMSVFALLGARKSDVLVALERAVRSTGLMVALAVLVIAIAAPLAEEVFFRGYAQTRLTERFGRGFGILIATSLFALLHMDPMHIVVAFAIGVVLAWTTERTGSIRAAIFAHVVNNGLFVLAPRGDPTPPTWTSALILTLVVVLALAGIAALTRAPNRAFVEP